MYDHLLFCGDCVKHNITGLKGEIRERFGNTFTYDVLFVDGTTAICNHSNLTYIDKSDVYPKWDFGSGDDVLCFNVDYTSANNECRVFIVNGSDVPSSFRFDATKMTVDCCRSNNIRPDILRHHEITGNRIWALPQREDQENLLIKL